MYAASSPLPPVPTFWPFSSPGCRYESPALDEDDRVRTYKVLTLDRTIALFFFDRVLKSRRVTRQCRSPGGSMRWDRTAEVCTGPYTLLPGTLPCPPEIGRALGWERGV